MDKIFYLCATTFDASGNATHRLANNADLGFCRSLDVHDKPVAFDYVWATFHARKAVTSRRLNGAYISVVTLKGLTVYTAR